MILFALAAALAGPQPQTLHTYKDWVVGCDNVRVCQANALMPEEGADDYLMVTITRSNAPGDHAALSVPLPDKTAAGTRFTLKVDGAQVAAFSAQGQEAATLPLSRTLLTALLAGQRLALFDASGKSIDEASLGGLAAALLYIDAQQQRVGTAGALKATGTKPDSSVPTAPATPLIAAPAPSSKAPRTITAALATKLIGPDDATCEEASSKVEPHAYRLDASHSLILVDHPCGNGAYNYFTSVYVLDESGPPREAQFDLAPGMSENAGKPGSGELTNGDWDAKSRQLTSYEKGRGIGDCGSSEAYAWDGARFRLVEQNVMGECRGSIDYIRVWTAQAGR